MKTFTVVGGAVRAGIDLAESQVPRINVGSSGRGRKLVVVPAPAGSVVDGRQAASACPEGHRTAVEIGREQYPGLGVSAGGTSSCRICGGARGYQPLGGVWELTGDVRAKGHAELPSKPGVLTDVPAADGKDDACVVLIKDHSGFRGGWKLRGARSEEEWDDIVSGRVGKTGSPESDAWVAAHPDRPHGCRVIGEGRCAGGDAGGMGGGPEYLLVLPEGAAVEIVRSGRLYGSPATIRLANVAGVVTASQPRAEAETRLAAAAW